MPCLPAPPSGPKSVDSFFLIEERGKLGGTDTESPSGDTKMEVWWLLTGRVVIASHWLSCRQVSRQPSILLLWQQSRKRLPVGDARTLLPAWGN